MEKRVEKRINFHVKGSIEHNGSSCSGDIENLSMKGMFIKACSEIPEGTDVLAIIHLSGASSDLTVRIDGKVARNEPRGIAVTFNRIDLDSYNYLKNIISYNMPEKW